MRAFQHGLGEGAGRVEPVAVDADVIFAALEAVDREPVDEIGIAGPPTARAARSIPSRSAAIASDGRAPSIRARAGPSSQSGASARIASSRLPR
jgi:hypothetical protein